MSRFCGEFKGGENCSRTGILEHPFAKLMAFGQDLNTKHGLYGVGVHGEYRILRTFPFFYPSEFVRPASLDHFRFIPQHGFQEWCPEVFCTFILKLEALDWATDRTVPWAHLSKCESMNPTSVPCTFLTGQCVYNDRYTVVYKIFGDFPADYFLFDMFLTMLDDSGCIDCENLRSRVLGRKPGLGTKFPLLRSPFVRL